MQILSNRFLIAAFFVLPIMAHACSDAYVGKLSASDDSIVIGDFGCAFPERTIFKLTPAVLATDGTLKPVAPVAFDSECQVTKKGGFACRKNGVSVLAGTTYKSVPTKEWACKPENYRPPKLICIAGCNKPGVPKEFKVIVYECGM